MHSQTKAAAATSPATNANTMNAATTAPAASTSAPAAANVAVLPPPQAVNHLPPTVATNPYAEMEQQQYLDLVRQYQLTKMKRQILEEEAGVANAQKTIADASKGQASPVSGSSSFNGYAARLRTGYQLAYLDRQAGQWVATLNQNGQYIEVREGSSLNDGWQVISITRSGVILSNGERQRTLGFQGSENTDISQNGYSISNQKPPATLPPQAMQVKNIAQTLGMTPGVTAGVPAAKGVALPNNNNLIIQPQSAKTAAAVIQDVPAAPTAARIDIPPNVSKQNNTPAVLIQPNQTSGVPAAAAQTAPKPAAQPVITTVAPVQTLNKSKNISTANNTSNKNNTPNKNNNQNNVSTNNVNASNVNTNQNSKTTLNQKIMEKAPMPANVKNIAGPVDQAPVNDAIIPAPTASTNKVVTNNTNKNSNANSTSSANTLNQSGLPALRFPPPLRPARINKPAKP